MEEVITDLQTVKFWILAGIGIIFGVIANFLTDWIKSFIVRFDGNKVKQIFNLRSNFHLPLYLGCLLLSLQSLFFIHIGYYWTARLLALCIASYYALEVFSIYIQYLPIDTTDRESIIQREMIFVFAKAWFIIFGMPRVTYWLIEIEYINFVQGVFFIITIYIANWVVTSVRRNSNAA